MRQLPARPSPSRAYSFFLSNILDARNSVPLKHWGGGGGGGGLANFANRELLR